MVVIRNWSVKTDQDGYQHIVGDVYGSSKYQNGRLVSTSAIVKWKPQEGGYWIAITASGSCYTIFPEMELRDPQKH